MILFYWNMERFRKWERRKDRCLLIFSSVKKFIGGQKQQYTNCSIQPTNYGVTIDIQNSNGFGERNTANFRNGWTILDATLMSCQSCDISLPSACVIIRIVRRWNCTGNLYLHIAYVQINMHATYISYLKTCISHAYGRNTRGSLLMWLVMGFSFLVHVSLELQLATNNNTLFQ
jgi:hypothetical protein